MRLENVYWDQLKELAETDAVSLNSLVFQLVGGLGKSTNKTATLRTYCLHRLRQEMVLTSIKTGNIDLATIITACPVPAMILTPERKIAAYNPAFVEQIMAPATTRTNNAGAEPLRLTFTRPFNQIIKQVVDNPRSIIQGQIGFSVGGQHSQRRARYALVDRSRGADSFIVVFLDNS